jgi:hypothetical protein
VASDVPSPVEAADGLGFGVGVAVGLGLIEGVDDGVDGATDGVEEGLAWALGDFFEDPPKPRMTAKAATATTMAV